MTEARSRDARLSVRAIRKIPSGRSRRQGRDVQDSSRFGYEAARRGYPEVQAIGSLRRKSGYMSRYSRCSEEDNLAVAKRRRGLSAYLREMVFRILIDPYWKACWLEGTPKRSNLPGPAGEQRSKQAAGWRMGASGSVAGIVLAALAPVSIAAAQTASQITPASVRPPARTPAGGIVLPEAAGPSAPKGAEGLKVTLSGVTIEGDINAETSGEAVAAARRSAIGSLSGKTVTVAAIFRAAQALEAAYGRAGFILTRVVVPAQKLVDGGKLRLVVIDGFIEAIETKALPVPVRGRIEAVLAPVVGRRHVTLAVIERALVLAGDTPGTVLKSTLARGQQPGGSVLAVEARHKLVTGSVSIDNSLSPSLGTISPTLALQLNSALGLGEQVYVQISGYPDLSGSHGFFTERPINRQLSAGAILPLGTDGLSLNLEATRTDSAPNPEAGQAYYSRFERFSGRLKYPWVHTRSFNLSSEIGFDAEEEALSLYSPTDAPISLDRLRVIRHTTEITGVTPWGAFVSGRVIASLGLDALGARDAASATPTLPLSRQGTDASFQKLEFAGHYGQALAAHLGIDLFARAQTSFGKPMARAEQIGLVGSNGLTAFDAGLFQGDSGIVGRVEVSSPWSVDLAQGLASASPYLFGDLGSIWLMQPTSVERQQTNAASWGLGFRLGAAPAPPGSPNASVLSGILDQVSFSLEWGHQYRSDAIRASDRLTISSSIQF
ncbi:MAG: ShlB/FhaC/HecB family hemolysin secretion/activation protein [Ancalomicrobiaceae bacterium]|nr:ShlB/FhaC/HecB family hemolysin secretion/activation protein [Ancalomicrobiaceae bacterium]